MRRSLCTPALGGDSPVHALAVHGDHVGTARGRLGLVGAGAGASLVRAGAAAEDGLAILEGTLAAIDCASVAERGEHAMVVRECVRGCVHVRPVLFRAFLASAPLQIGAGTTSPNGSWPLT